MTPAISAVPAGHRRISSLRSTTFNFFKGNNRGSQLQHSGSIRRNELTISNPIPLPLTDENVSPTSSMPTRADSEPVVNNRTPYSPTGYEGSNLRARISTTRLDSMVVEEEGGESITVGMDPRELSPQPTRQSEIENSISDKMTTTPSARSKTTSNKLKMALSLLRRRSNSNLRKDYSEIKGTRGEKPRVASPFNEVNYECVYADQNTVEPSRAASPSVTLTTATSQKPTGFGFGRGSRAHGRQVLTKPPPCTTRRPRRATVTSVSYDDENDPERRNSGWTRLQPRPASSQSGAIKNAPQMEEGPSSDSIVSPDSGPSGGGSANPGGGLFPRPVSLQRHWSDGPRQNRESNVRYGVGERSPAHSSGRASQEPDRIRPLSFGGVLNGYGSMKITEAASLESRVRDLESQIATLQTFISQQGGITSEQRLLPAIALQRHPLQSPFDEQKMHKRNYSASSKSSSLMPEDSDGPQTPKNKTPVNQLDESATPKPSTPSPSTLQNREEAIQALEGNSSNSESRRNTSSTVRAVAMVDQGKGSSGSEDGNRSPMPVVSLAQYTGLVTVVKREQRARRKLENQVANLQEQMALVLHRHLLAQSNMSPAITEATSAGLRPDFNSIRRKTSSEVPTPDLTPPRASPIEPIIPAGNPFTGFDSDLIPDGSEDSLYMGADLEENEIWETPAEERESMVGVHDWDDERGYTEGSSTYRNSYRNSQTRTMSLSQLTHKSSLANR